MNSEILERLLKFFGVYFVYVGNMQTGYRNKSYKITTADGTELNLIIFKPEPGILERIERADAVSEAVAEYGFPVRKRYSNKTAVLKSASGRVSYARLYKYLPGETIPWEAYSKNHIKLLGQAMSDIHFAVKDLNLELPSVAHESNLLNKQMESYFAKNDVREALKAKLGLKIDMSVLGMFKNVLNSADKLPDQVPLHMDLVRGNVLYSGTLSPKAPFQPSRKVEGVGQAWQIGDLSLTGVIDFEKTARGHEVFDIARTYAFLTVDCQQKSPSKIYKYLVYSGYNKRGKNKVELPRVFYKLVDFYLFYDFYKFLLHNPYESLPDNHHFCLTRDILLKKNVLKFL